jgi:hypothetical protein
MKKIAFTMMWLAGCATFAAGSAESHEIKARVDARVELMSLVFRLAGAEEYCQPGARSPYSDEADAHFAAFKDHDVVRAAQEARRRRGVGFDAVMSLALHLRDTETLELRVPMDFDQSRLDKRWTEPMVIDFLEKARAFVEASGFNAFIASHEALFDAAAQAMTDRLREQDYVGWFDGYFGARPGARFEVIVGMLNGPGNYGMSIRLPDGSEEISPVIGAGGFDGGGVPRFPGGVSPLLIHEFCHPYTNPLVDRFAAELAAPGARIYAHCRRVMSKQAYGSWRTMLYESLVRACVVRCIASMEGKRAAKKEILRQHGRGFKWTGALCGVLEEYEENRDQYPDLGAFMPEVVAFFDEYAACYDDIDEDPPRVISMIPANGAGDVDPGLNRIEVVFDRPMLDGSWAVVGGGPEFPELTGDSGYNEDRTVFTCSVKLEPNHTYRFWLNHGEFIAFMSEEGVPLESVAVTFRTREK